MDVPLSKLILTFHQTRHAIVLPKLISKTHVRTVPMTIDWLVTCNNECSRTYCTSAKANGESLHPSTPTLHQGRGQTEIFVTVGKLEGGLQAKTCIN